VLAQVLAVLVLVPRKSHGTRENTS
jgi:hypothetical protein